jgi:hypothetical protein
LRQKEAAEAETRRLTAAQQVEQAEQSEREKQELVQREGARAAAMRRQQEEQAARVRQALVRRTIYPVNYKRREHYYIGVDLYNARVLQNAAPTGPEPSN